MLLSVAENILYFISGFGVLQAILLAGLIYFHPKSDRSVNKFFALYIFFTSAVMTMPYLIDAIGWKHSWVIMPLPLFPGPFLYFYLLSFKETITLKKAWPHFIPALAFFVFTYFNLSRLAELYPDSKKIPVEGLKRYTTLGILLFRNVVQFTYYFLSRKALNSYQRSIQNLFSETSRIDLQWARYLVNGYIILISAFLILFPLVLRFPDYFTSLLLVNMAIATPYIYGASYKGIMQPTIWQVQPTIKKQKLEEEIHEIETKNLNNNGEGPQTSKQRLPDDKISEIARKVIEMMEQEKLYQEPELTLQQLSDKLQFPYYLVSQAINEGMKKSFYDLINSYRIEEAKRLLLDPKNINYTVLSVGFEAGFNSKTTFNTVFKKFTGLTPTEYRDKQSINVAV
ncbi:MAG TPA: helix-turn-helix domain-containing protein [Chitinophagaceae bacterium]|jgi:AraC-like DNA-binding protein|nr:helix-turn-helix domain-containing protein [Chitinophagaceae bacterium]